MANKKHSPLPPLYATWMEKALGGPLPDEPFATCSQCAKWAPDGALPMPNNNAFHPRVKCCTYYPELYNFLVGGILGDKTALARPVVEARMRNGFAADPLGIHSTPTHDVLYKAIRDAFGRCEALRCPYFIVEGGHCGVYQHRYSICATWYCKYARGLVGSTFWASVQDLLGEVESLLARWCALKLGLTDENLKQARTGRAADSLGALDLDERIDPSAYRGMWGQWQAKEARFYKECARLVRRLTWPQILALGGFNLQQMAQRARVHYEKVINPALPLRLRLGNYTVDERKAESSVLVTYSSYDPLEVPQRVLDVLHYFDGRPVAAALAAIAEEKQMALDDSLLLALVDFEVLESVDEPGGKSKIPRTAGPSARSPGRQRI